MRTLSIIAIMLFTLTSCTNKGTSKDGSKNDTISIDWEQIPITEIPCEFNTLTINENDITKEKDNAVNVLFQDSTLLYHSLYRFGHPNNLKGVFYKRLPDVSENKVLVFFYNSTLIASEYAKTYTIILQTFAHDNHLIDKIIISDAAYGENCYWERLAKCKEGNIIEIIDESACDHSNKKNQYKYSYIINEKGRIIRYYQGAANKDNLEEYSYFALAEVHDNKGPISKGPIRNHLKEGIWEEHFTEYQLKMNEDDPTKICGFHASGNYHLGEKDGEWIYYYSDCVGFEHLFRGEIYDNGVLIKSTFDSNNKEAFKIYYQAEEVLYYGNDDDNDK